MKILYDHQIFGNQYHGGASRMFCDLIRHLQKRANVELEISIRWSNNEYLHSLDSVPTGRFLRGLHVPGAVRIMMWGNRNKSRKVIAKGCFDLLHATYYDPYFLGVLRGTPFVITIFDMIHEIWPQFYRDARETTRRKRLLAEKAARVITISQNSKNDIIRFFDVKPDKIEVIYPSTSISFDQTEGPESSEAFKTILYVGTRAVYKNFGRFLRAIRSPLVKRPRLELLCVGGGPFTPSEKHLIEEFGLSPRIKQASLTDRELATAYSRSLALVFPSQYEGFGLPILEAFKCGCPVVAGNTSSVPEVAGDAAVYFDPIDIGSIESAIDRVVDDLALREDLRAKGRERLRLFDWEKAASQTQSVYESVL